MSNCIYCNTDEIHPKRIEILKSKNQDITCIKCAENKVDRVTGFQVNHGKGTREIEVCTPTQGQRLMKMERKTGGATGGPGIYRNAGKVVYKK